MISVIILSLNDHLVSLNLNVLCIRDYGKSQMLSDLRTNLCGITIDCLTTGNDQIIVKVSQCTCNGSGSSPGISTAQYSVGNQNCFVSTHSQRLTKSICCLGKTHGQYGNFCAELVLQLQCSFQTSLIIGIHDSKHCASVKSSVRIEFNTALGIGHLLNTNNNLHCIFSLLF